MVLVVRDLGDNENITKCQVIHAYYDHHLTGSKERYARWTYVLLGSADC